MNRKKAGIAFLLLGAVLILSALLLFLRNTEESRAAGESAREALEEMQEYIWVIPTQPESETSGETAQTEPVDPTMTVKTINGHDYIGYLSLPKLELELPVMDEWSYPDLQISPCRELGSVKTDDMVVIAHNYPSHFGRLKELQKGDEVSFTDMDGKVWEYKVSAVETVDPHNVEKVHNSTHDLVLYTCTVGGEFRVTAFCDREKTDETQTEAQP